MKAETELKASVSTYGKKVTPETVELILFSEDHKTSLYIPLHLMHGVLLQNIKHLIDVALDRYYEPVRRFKQQTKEN